MSENRGEAKELWSEALEEDSAPAFELKTYDQFIEFIKIGITSLLEHKKLDKIENITDKHKDLIADIGLFVSLHGSYQKWKTERKQLKGKLAQALNQLKKLTVEHKTLNNMKVELEKRSKDLELKSTEIDIRKSEFEKSNIKLESEIDTLNKRINSLNKEILDLSHDDGESTDSITSEQLNDLCNAKIDYELELFDKQEKIELLMNEINAVDLHRKGMDEILIEYRTYLGKIDEFRFDYDQMKSKFEELDKERRLLIESRKSEEDKLEKIDSDIDAKKLDESKIQDELNKYDVEIEKINKEKTEKLNMLEEKQYDIEKAKAKLDEILNQKGDLDEKVQEVRTKARNFDDKITKKQNMLRLKITEATNTQAKIDDKLTNIDQVATLTQNLHDIRLQIDNLKEEIVLLEQEKQENDSKLADLTKNHNVFETQISEIRRKIESSASNLLDMQNEVRKSENRIDTIEIEKKTIIAQNQELLDELANMKVRKEQLEEKIVSMETEVAEMSSAIDEENKKINQGLIERNVFFERKYEFENRIIGLEGLLPRNSEQESEKSMPMPFGAEWTPETPEDPDLANLGKKDQFLNYKKLTDLRHELSSTLPRKLELKFRIGEIENLLERVEVEYSKSIDEKKTFEAESEQKNTAFEIEIDGFKTKIKELTEEITSSNMKKIELMEEKEKLYASFKSQPKMQTDEDGSDLSEDTDSAENQVMSLMREEISEKEKEIFDIGEKINKFETEKLEFRSKLENSVQKRDEYNSKFNHVVKQCDRLLESKSELEEELKNKRPILSNIVVECNKTELAITETGAEYYAQTSEYVRLIHQLKNQNEEVAVIDAEIENLEKELKQITQEKEQIKEIKKQAIEEEDKLTDELRNMKLLAEVTEEEVIETKKLLEDAEEKVEHNDDLLKEFWQKIHETERVIVQNKERKEKILSSRGDLEEHVNAIEALMLTKEKLMKSIRDEHINADEQIEALKTEKTITLVQYENSIQQRKYIESINEELLNKIKQIKDKYDNLYDEYLNSDSVVKDLKIKYPIMEKELEKSRSTEKNALTKLIQFEEQNTRKQDNTKALELMKSALNKDIAQLKQELNHVQLEKGDLEAEHEQLNIQVQKQSLTINELREKLLYFQELERKFEALKKRNEYLEAEMKKFSSLLGFEDIDITTELKQKLINSATMNLSARFLQKGWDYKKTFLHPDEVQIEEKISDSLNILSKPFDAMKLRLNLRKFFESIKKEIPEQLEKYRVFFEKRTDEKPLNNTELKEICSIASYFGTIEEMLEGLKQNLKISVP
ncbi:MAG: hypothetical protein K8S87_07825 [Planctomycetes bacterium]|nr:hypothetical protein [Planctomycetota bacterium]